MYLIPDAPSLFTGDSTRKGSSWPSTSEAGGRAPEKAISLFIYILKITFLIFSDYCIGGGQLVLSPAVKQTPPSKEEERDENLGRR